MNFSVLEQPVEECCDFGKINRLLPFWSWQKHNTTYQTWEEDKEHTAIRFTWVLVWPLLALITGSNQKHYRCFFFDLLQFHTVFTPICNCAVKCCLPRCTVHWNCDHFEAFSNFIVHLLFGHEKREKRTWHLHDSQSQVVKGNKVTTWVRLVFVVCWKLKSWMSIYALPLFFLREDQRACLNCGYPWCFGNVISLPVKTCMLNRSRKEN